MNIQLQEISLPVGSVTAFAGNIKQTTSSPPSEDHSTYSIEAWGWMECDGRELSPSQYPELFSALGYLYGGSSDKFNIPDLRGMFLRGVGKAKDKDGSELEGSLEDRKKAHDGTNDGVGSTQQFAMQKHIHVYAKPETPIATGKAPSLLAAPLNPKGETSGPCESAIAGSGKVKVSLHETRPVNMFVHYLIKYTSRLPYFK